MLDQELIRLNKLKFLKKKGVLLYPFKTLYITDNLKNIKKKKIKKKIFVVGRIFNIIKIGKIFFFIIKDFYSNIQLYIKKKNLKKFSYFLIYNNLLDIGDIIYVIGKLFITKKKILTIKVIKIKLLCKSLKVLPQIKINKIGKVFNKFSNVEKIYRYRYIDLIVNNKSKKKFLKRFKISYIIRNFLNKKKFIEVETPILHPIYGGADAKPFMTYHNKIKNKLYLRIANEIYLKKLIVGGFDKIYEFSKNFRNEGVDKLHNPEFSMLELYISYKDYFWMMKFCEKMLYYICKKIYNKNYIKYGKNIIYFNKPFKKISLYKIIDKTLNIINIKKYSLKKLLKLLKKLNIKINKKKKINKNIILLKIFEKKCQKKCIQPTYIIDYPKSISPFAKIINNTVHRFELFINGFEIANAYTELNDPYEQLCRFKNNNYKNIDYDFINALKIGMPPTAGIGIGIDRLCMLFTNSKSIQEIILFPQMKII
ncbi:MAG: lysine--tRNA ligase [Candidatus Shikimatogenerans sp. Ttur]|uniref:Lysine--tRNA ligase n=1 Tax=Candidatus Shikimatogenerans sp. Ttur TaxID=3158569 RepID=A0AAU7ZXP6_9FLAO